MRNGSRAIALSILTLAAGVFLLFAGTAIAGKKKEKPLDTYSVVAGTVFREPGLALPEADVTLAMAGDEASKKIKKLSFSTNTRGEFAFRLPAVKGSYVVTASAKGFRKQQKTVEVQPEERVDVTFMLSPESK